MRLHQLEAAVKNAQGLAVFHQGLQLPGSNYGGVVHCMLLVRLAQCSSAGALGAARARSTVAAMPLVIIKAMPAQPDQVM